MTLAPTDIYLDYAATTPVDPRVVEVMLQHLGPGGLFGNPASRHHRHGVRANAAVERARQQVAALLNADEREIIWTSGATESNNLALMGAAAAYRSRGRHIVTCKTEHKAVLDPCQRLERQGFCLTYLDPNGDGEITPGQLANALRDDTVLVSLMHANNETGVIHNIAELGEVVRSRGALLHVDAAQSLGKLPIDLKRLPVDLLSASAHKLYGPKGVGILYVRRRPKVRLEPLLFGGGQERGLRSGTLATHQIVGMGEACALAQRHGEEEQARLGELAQRLWERLRGLGEVYLNGDEHARLSHCLNVSFIGVDAEALMVALPDVAVSAGSACTSAQAEPSHVLRAMGLSLARSSSAIRFSLGRFTTAAEIDAVGARVCAAVVRLRALSPWWELEQSARTVEQIPWAYP